MITGSYRITQIKKKVYDAANDPLIDRLINKVLLLIVEDGKSLKDFMIDFDLAGATMQRDRKLLKAHQFVIFEGYSKSGCYKLLEEFKLKLEIQ